MAHTRTPAPIRKCRRPCHAFAAALSFTVVLALSTTTGCMVMDELDTAAAKMPSTNKKKEESAKKAAGKPGSGAAGQIATSKAAVLEASRQWWKKAKTINDGKTPEGIVSCRLPEGSKFMSKDDCVVQGGQPGNASS